MVRAVVHDESVVVDETEKVDKAAAMLNYWLT